MNATSKSVFSSRRYTQLTLDRLKAWSLFRPAYWFPVLLCAALGLPESASALPSYARQTGHPCIKCHVGGFGPQLTPYGVRFKIGAYTETDHKGLKIPVAAFAYGGFTHTAKEQNPPPLDEHANDNVTLDQISGFIAGRWFEDVGSFLQVTYNGNTEGLSADNTDIRYAHDWAIAGLDVIIGASVNNNPTVQDPFNTLFAWNFPFLTSAVAFGNGVGPQITGGLGPAVHGETVYAFIDDSILAEVGTYQAWSPAMQVKLGLGAGNDIGRVNKSIYWRLAYTPDLNTQGYGVGLIGFNLSRIPAGTPDGGPDDRYRDIGADGWYEFLGNGRHNIAAYASYVREDATLSNTFSNGGAANLTNRLYDFRVNASYYYDQTYGLTIGRFSRRGTNDPILYGAVTGSPDTSATIFQVDYTPFGKADSWGRPFANVRVGVQYTIYDKFAGASSNYDGSGRNASDNNTLYFFIWGAI
jgi:hypothetical protein